MSDGLTLILCLIVIKPVAYALGSQMAHFILNLETFIGWKLDEAKAALAQDGSTPAAPIVLIETDPAQRKNSTDTFGDWRVLRCRTDENQNLELTVARELLSENRAPSARP